MLKLKMLCSALIVVSIILIPITNSQAAAPDEIVQLMEEILTDPTAPTTYADLANQIRTDPVLAAEVSSILSEYGFTNEDFLPVYDALGAGDARSAADLLWELVGGEAVVVTRNSTTTMVTDKVMRDIALPPTRTEREKKEAKAKEKLGAARILAGYLRFESVEMNNEDGNIIGANIGIAWDKENISYGLIIPFDNIDIGNQFEGQRFGAIGFCTFKHDLKNNLNLGITGNLNLVQLNVDGQDNILFYGGGITSSLTKDFGRIEPGIALSYQFTQDDSDTEDDQQHLIKLAGKLGIRIKENSVVNIYAVYNRDVTDYSFDIDEDSIDLALEGKHNISDSFTLSAGVKKIFDFDGYESDMIYLGAAYTF